MIPATTVYLRGPAAKPEEKYEFGTPENCELLVPGKISILSSQVY